MKIDFHIHTNCSDGVYSPAEVIDRAAREGYNMLAITDHDSAAAHAALKDYPLPENLRIIKGVEITSNYQDREIHILGYFRDGFAPELESFLKGAQEERNRRMNTSIKNLEQFKISVTYKELFKYSKGESVGRNHLASLLVDKGYVASQKEAFNLYLNDDTAIVPPMMTSVKRAIELIHGSNGIAAWAHPAYENFQAFVPVFVGYGLDAIEVYNQKRSLANARHYRNTAEGLGLMATAGSDWHGFEGESFLTNYLPEVVERFVNIF
ncbi:MAG: PHP domain-containing protein [Candidatus Brocadiia bacterium]